MLKRIFVAVLIGAIFFVGVQFAAVLFYAFEFDDFVHDEVRFTPMRENPSTEHLVEHIAEQARYYGLIVNKKEIVVDRHTERDTGIRRLSVDLEYSSPVDLYYFTSHVRRHLHASTAY